VSLSDLTHIGNPLEQTVAAALTGLHSSSRRQLQHRSAPIIRPASTSSGRLAIFQHI